MGGRVSVDKPKVNLSLKSEMDGNKFDCCDEISCASSCCIFTISPNKQGSGPSGLGLSGLGLSGSGLSGSGLSGSGPVKEQPPVINLVEKAHDAVVEIARITDVHFVLDSSPKTTV